MKWNGSIPANSNERSAKVIAWNYNFRIVAGVDQLMSLCDELEAGLTRSQADSEKLIRAVVGRMLAE